MQQESPTMDGFSAELLATVGHEFRGPLTTIQGYATTLLRHDQQLTSVERQEFLHAINEASAHLGKLVDRFLTLAQFETHAHTLLSTPVNLLVLAQESITALQESRPHHLLLIPSPIRTSPSEEGMHGAVTHDEQTLSGDRRLLRTMLDILLENAVAYSTPESLVEVSIDSVDAASALAEWQAPTGPGTHRELIASRPFQAWERLLVLRVRDHGIGIEPAHLTLIFRRFYRVDTSLTREVNGLGLGLALCQAIVALHRGMLWVDSAVGEGTTFSIVLPCEMVPEGNAQVAAE
ncbi:MAG TPA: HAMP domain-containing sensor histidine kinase [Ktedonobacteraceae bacterium]